LTSQADEGALNGPIEHIELPFFAVLIVNAPKECHRCPYKMIDEPENFKLGHEVDVLAHKILGPNWDHTLGFLESNMMG
jgi:hypothetical protein